MRNPEYFIAIVLCVTVFVAVCLLLAVVWKL